MNEIPLFFKSINQIRKREIDNDVIGDFFKSAMEILNCAKKKAKIKDEFSEFYYEPRGVTYSCFLKSEKTNSKYTIFYDSYTNEIVFYSSIDNWENIKNLTDGFWSDFLEKSQENNFRFENYESTIYDNDNAPEFKNKYKSINFNIMSHYVSAMLHSEEERKNIGFGQLAISWNPNHSITQVISQIETSFKYFYKFNYNLWKVGDIRRQNKINRNK